MGEERAWQTRRSRRARARVMHLLCHRSWVHDFIERLLHAGRVFRKAAAGIRRAINTDHGRRSRRTHCGKFRDDQASDFRLSSRCPRDSAAKFSELNISESSELSPISQCAALNRASAATGIGVLESTMACHLRCVARNFTHQLRATFAAITQGEAKMDSEWTIPTPEEVRQRATEVRRTWSPAERLARLSLPPDSLLLRRAMPMRQSRTRNESANRLKSPRRVRSRNTSDIR